MPVGGALRNVELTDRDSMRRRGGGALLPLPFIRIKLAKGKDLTENFAFGIFVILNPKCDIQGPLSKFLCIFTNTLLYALQGIGLRAALGGRLSINALTESISKSMYFYQCLTRSESRAASRRAASVKE